MMVELFSGVGNVARAFRELGFETLTVDHDCCFGPDVTADIRRWRPGESPEPVQVLWASPPCTTYSCLSNFKHWNKDVPKSLDACGGSACLIRTLELIDELKPKWWFIENPTGLMRRHMGLPRYEIHQCGYGKDVQKPTDIWSNFPGWHPIPKCKRGDPCHRAAPRGSSTGTQGKPSIGSSIIPYKLAVELANSVVIYEDTEEQRNLGQTYFY